MILAGGGTGGHIYPALAVGESLRRQAPADLELLYIGVGGRMDDRIVSRAGLPFESEPHDQPWLWREAHLQDPAGNQICLFHAGGNRRDPPWRLPENG